MKLYDLMENPKLAGAAPALGVQTAMDQHTASPIGSGTSKWEANKRAVTMMGAGGPQKVKMNEVRDIQLDEISNKILGDYKKAAGADARAADRAGDFKRGDKRFKGIVQATKKELANDVKQHKEVDEDNDAIAAFLARGGEIQQVKPQRGPKRSGVSFASKHIGSASGRGTTKGKVSGLGANTGKTAKPVVTTEVSDKTLVGYLNKVHDDSLKHDQDPTKRSAEKRNKSVSGFAQAFNKLDSRKPDGTVKESLGRAIPKMPKPRDPGHAVLAAKRTSGAGGQHTNKKRQALLQPKHQKPLTRDMDLGEGWKSALGGAALAGAMAMGGGAAHAQNAPSGADSLPSIVAHISFVVNGETVTKDFNLGNKFSSPGQASAAVEKLMKDKGIKYANWTLERVSGNDANADDSYLDSSPASATQGPSTSNYADNTPYKTSGKTSGDYMAKEDLEESIERRLMQMRRAGYDIT